MMRAFSSAALVIRRFPAPRLSRSLHIRPHQPRYILASKLLPRQKMSTQAIAGLSAPIRDLVQAISGQQTEATMSEAELQAVDEWLTKISKLNLTEDEWLKDLEASLSSKTYLVGASPSPADIALYAALHPIMSNLPSSTYYSYPSVTRYFDHIQNLPSVRSNTSAAVPAVVQFDLENAPKPERKAEPVKKKEKKAKPEGGESSITAQTASVVKDDVEEPAKVKGQPATDKKKEKEKKPKKEQTAAAAGASGGKKAAGAAGVSTAEAAADSGAPTPAMIDLRVGHIVDVKVHPDADGLYIEQIDLGEETGPRTIVSGLVKYVPIEQMRDKQLIVVANLKAASMRGVKSFGMVLCATAKEGKEGGIEIIDPPAGSKPGDRVFFEGEKYENVQPLAQMNPKKKIFETIQPGFITLETREAAWIDPETKSVHRILTKLGPCTAPTFVGASLS